MAIVSVLLCACASTNKSTPTVAVAPPAVAPSAGALPAAQKPAVANDPRVAASEKRAREMGYHTEMRHGEQFYCRTTAPLGSRLTQKECLTAETMAQAAQIEEENQVARRQGQLCQGGGCSVN
jgi:hypothetical protein